MLRRCILYIFRFFGLRVERLSHDDPIDFTESTNNPKSILYITNFKKQIIINAELSNGRGLDFFSLDCQSNHPFIASLRMALLSNRPLTPELNEHLKAYYSLVQPSTSSSWLGIKKKEYIKDDNSNLIKYVMPWENISPQTKHKERNIVAKHDSQEHGEMLNLNDGWRNYGPISEKVLNLEVNRIMNLKNSIEKKGFKPSKRHGHIGAIVLLRSDDTWKWYVENGGQHRAPVLSALGYKDIPIRVWKIINEDDASIWPNVVSGLYTESEALKIFDNVCKGNNGQILEPWNKYLLEKNEI